MANLKYANPDLITSAGSGNETLIFPALGEDKNELVIKLTVVSGNGFKFNVLGLASASNLTVTAGESVTVTLWKGYHLSYKASAAGETFKVEI